MHLTLAKNCQGVSMTGITILHARYLTKIAGKCSFHPKTIIAKSTQKHKNLQGVKERKMISLLKSQNSHYVYNSNHDWVHDAVH